MTLEQERIRLQGILTNAHEEYEKKLTAYAFLKVHNRATSEDMVQVTFMKTWAYLVQNGKIDMMKSFLYHTLSDLVVDEYRKNKTVSLDMLLEKGFEPSDNDFEHLYDIMDGKTAVVLIQLLPKKYQNVMRMRYVQELSLAEISLLTGETKNTIAVQSHRGLQKLKKLYRHS